MKYVFILVSFMAFLSPTICHAFGCTGRITEVALKKESGEIFIRGEAFQTYSPGGDKWGTVICYITGNDPQADAICEQYLAIAQSALLSGRPTTISFYEDQNAPECANLKVGARVYYLKLHP